MSTNTRTSQDLRIRSEGRVEVLERAVFRLERAVASFDADTAPGDSLELSADEREALEHVERLDPGAGVLTALRNAQRKLVETMKQWADRHCLKSAEGHLPVLLKQRLWGFRAGRGLVVASLVIPSGIVAAVVDAPQPVQAFFGAAIFFLPLLAALVPTRREVLVTQRSLVVDREEIPFDDIVSVTALGNWLGRAVVQISRKTATTAIAMRFEHLSTLQDALDRFRAVAER